MKIRIFFLSLMFIIFSCDETSDTEDYTICDLNGYWKIHTKYTKDSTTELLENFDLECNGNNVSARNYKGEIFSFLADGEINGTTIKASPYNSIPRMILTFNSKKSFDYKLYDTNNVEIIFGKGTRLYY